MLEKYGKTIRVDHRTLDAQQEEAEQNGDSFLSKVNLRVAEEYIGIQKSHYCNPFVVDLKKTRERNFQRFQSCVHEDINQTASKEFEVKELVKQAELSARRFPSLFTTDITKLNGLKRRFTTTRQNIEKAQSEYLSPNELKTLKSFKESLRQIYHLENLAKELKRPKEFQVKNLAAYEEINAAISKKIATIRESLNSAEVERIEQKLETGSTYKNVAFVAHQHFQANLKILEEMAKTSEDILSESHKKEEKGAPVIPEIFSMSDIKENLRLQYRSLKMQQETAEDRLAEMRQKVISASRALLIAKNIFLNGELKKLNAEKRKYEKAAKKFESDIEFFSQEKIKFEKAENYTEKFQHSYFLTKSKIEIELRQKNLANWKNKLDDRTQQLEKHCALKDTKEKIGIIAASILRKNLPQVQNFESAKKKLGTINQKLKEMRNRLDFISEYSVKQKYYYRVLDSARLPKKTLSDKNAIISLIADALRGENYRKAA